MNVNLPLKTRIDGIFSVLNSSYLAGTELSSATKGTERELFINAFLAQVFPTHYRFCSGDITCSNGGRSGQIDIVMEFPRGFSFPFHPNGPRLFLAEGVAAAIEIKSNLMDQWDEVVSTGTKLQEIERVYQPDYNEKIAVQIESNETLYSGPQSGALFAAQLRQQASLIPNRAERRIPLFAVGFTGWKTQEALKTKLQCGVVDAVFILDSQLYASNAGPAEATGAYSMVMFLEQLEQHLSKTTAMLPVAYGYRL